MTSATCIFARIGSRRRIHATSMESPAQSCMSTVGAVLNGEGGGVLSDITEISAPRPKPAAASPRMAGVVAACFDQMTMTHALRASALDTASLHASPGLSLLSHQTEWPSAATRWAMRRASLRWA